jgi:transposase-like protein
MKIKRPDARSLPPLVQEHLRFQAVNAVLGGRSMVNVAASFGITRQAVHNWMKAHRRGGPEALAARPRGRPRTVETPSVGVAT